MVRYCKGIPIRDVGNFPAITATALVRLPVDLKTRLEGLRKELQRNSWSYISYGDAIEYLFQMLDKK